MVYSKKGILIIILITELLNEPNLVLPEDHLQHRSLTRSAYVLMTSALQRASCYSCANCRSDKKILVTSCGNSDGTNQYLGVQGRF
jgi:hypothetical protein